MTEQSSQGRETLLVVDDEPQVCDTLRRVLSRDGYRVLTANSAAEALQELEHNSVDVIITDQRMPRETGIVLLGKVREKWPDVIRFLLSGAAEIAEVEKAVADGTVHRFLSKPAPGSLLRQQLQEALATRRSSAPRPVPE